MLSRYRFLRSTYLYALVGGKSRKRFIERLGDLFHEGGYLTRPTAQWQTINASYMPVVYALGSAGKNVLEQHGVTRPSLSSLTWNAGRPGRHFQHELMVCDILASVEIATRADPHVRFVSWPEILAHPKMPQATRENSKPLATRVPVTYKPPGSHKLQRSNRLLVPDAVFGLEYATPLGNKYRFFALEADRQTQPVFRRTLSQSSVLRKILQYREIITHTLHRDRWGLPNLLVLMVTTGERHQANIMRLVEEMTAGQGCGYILFKTMPALASLESAPLPDPAFLTDPWHRAGQPDLFINRP